MKKGDNKKKKIITNSKIEKMFISTVAMMAVIFVLQIYGSGNNVFEMPLSGDTDAKVETWSEQTRKDKWFGTGFWQTRTLYTISVKPVDKSTVYENKQRLLSSTNKTKVAQSVGYTYKEEKGHKVSSEVKAKTAHFEAAVGYTFSYATSKSYKATATIPKKKTIVIWGYDVRVKKQYTVYNKQPQRANNLSATSWVNNGKATSSSPLIREYSSKHFTFDYI